LQFQSLLDQTEREDSVPQAVRHYLQEMAELTELAKERLDQVKVRLIADSGPSCPQVERVVHLHLQSVAKTDLLAAVSKMVSNIS